MKLLLALALTCSIAQAADYRTQKVVNVIEKTMRLYPEMPADERASYMVLMFHFADSIDPKHFTDEQREFMAKVRKGEL